MVAIAVLGPRVGDQLHPPHRLVVVGGLRGIADHEYDRIPPGDGERVAGRVVLDEPDELLELVQVEARVALLVGEVDRCAVIGPVR